MTGKANALGDGEKEEVIASRRRGNLGGGDVCGDCFVADAPRNDRRADAPRNDRRAEGVAIPHKCSYKSCHSLFTWLIKSIFLCREPALSCFSLIMAFCGSWKIS